MAITVGGNLTPLRTPLATRLSRALHDLVNMLQVEAGSSKKTLYEAGIDCHVYVKDGAPSTSNSEEASADSPGHDLCFVWDTTANDLYLISAWTAAGKFTATKVLD